MSIRAAGSPEFQQVISRLGLKADGQLTSEGFRFVMYERQKQLWCAILTFLRNCQAQDPAAISPLYLSPLKLILALGELKVGDCLQQPADALVGSCVRLLTDLGILYTEGGSSSSSSQQQRRSWVAPAALALFRRDASTMLSRSLTGAASLTAASQLLPRHLYRPECLERLLSSPGRRESHVEEQGLIVESNFKVYAYTSSSMHALLLGHFCRILLRLPNLLVGQLSAESALKAMKKGICSENIIGYLEAAAHPRALARRQEEDGASVVPANVRGQLEVWESSRSRTASKRAVLFQWQPGESEAIFELARKRAEESGTLLWCRKASSSSAGGSAAGPQDAAAPAPVLVVQPEGAAAIRALLAVKQEQGRPEAPPASKRQRVGEG